MALEDPFFVVKDEVQKTVETATALFHRWCELSSDTPHNYKEEYDWTTNELRNCLRSIEWDLEDLEETISIVERNCKKFKIGGSELSNRKEFVERTRTSVKDMRERMTNPKSRGKSKETHLLQQNIVNGNGPDKPQNKYTRLQNEVDIIDDRFTVVQHHPQDDPVSLVSSVSQALNDSSPQTAADQDEQTVMLEDGIREVSASDSKVGGVMKKMVKVFHLSRDWRQWSAISLLLIVVAIVITLFFVL